MIGNTISHCRIIEKLGAGGMGGGYRAVDTNLNQKRAVGSFLVCPACSGNYLTVPK